MGLWEVGEGQSPSGHGALLTLNHSHYSDMEHSQVRGRVEVIVRVGGKGRVKVRESRKIRT